MKVEKLQHLNTLLSNIEYVGNKIEQLKLCKDAMINEKDHKIRVSISCGVGSVYGELSYEVIKPAIDQDINRLEIHLAFLQSSFDAL